MARTGPEITYSEVSFPGVTVLWPGDPRFQAVLAAEWEPAETAAVEWALPYSLLVRSEGERRISSITVRRILTDDAGRGLAHTQTSQWGGAGLAAAEGFRWLGPGGMIAGRGRNSMGRGTGGGGGGEKYRDQAAVRVEIDSVVFADGWLVGPDVSRTMERMFEGIQAEEELSERVLALGGDSLRAYLEQTAALPGESLANPSGVAAGGFYREHLRGRARLLLTLLAHEGEERVKAGCLAMRKAEKIRPYR